MYGSFKHAQHKPKPFEARTHNFSDRLLLRPNVFQQMRATGDTDLAMMRTAWATFKQRLDYGFVPCWSPEDHWDNRPLAFEAGWRRKKRMLGVVFADFLETLVSTMVLTYL
jgi:hypothetical protein